MKLGKRKRSDSLDTNSNHPKRICVTGTALKPSPKPLLKALPKPMLKALLKKRPKKTIRWSDTVEFALYDNPVLEKKMKGAEEYETKVKLERNKEDDLIRTDAFL